ncbi:Ig-like domain-containing protein [Falsiroseomonas oryziterrae]|uniref:Ig-like domain-containing protein n=1 Tax=Falsiroseomonas oryziterrae TaxID=2911368 RepID=UPI001F2E56CD|nr:Ig-like domain-containing protein [Roseomonas sp. NPKOSM-4]
MHECPRQISFTIPGLIGVQVTITEEETGPGQPTGRLMFVIDVLDTTSLTGDLRGFFLHYDEAALSSLQVSGDTTLTGSAIKANEVIDLGNGDNMQGATSPFDIGTSFGTEGIGKGDDLSGPVTFYLSSTTGALLNLDDLAHLEVGARVTSIGAPGAKQRRDSEKIVTYAPAAPDAVNDFATTHEDTSVTIDVLNNDKSPDGRPLTIDSNLVVAPQHGTVTVAADGKSLTYTPSKDYAGLNLVSNSIDDSFVYCVHDGNGGQDHATVDLHIIPVADAPSFDVQVLAAQAGDPVNQVRLHVTASASDIDGSEFIDRIVIGGVPGNVTKTVTGTLDPAGQPDKVEAYVTLTLPTDVSSKFNLDVTAYSEEKGNGDPDTASATASKLIELEVKDTSRIVNFASLDQSIWGTGGGAPLDKEQFIGIDERFDPSVDFFVPNPVFPYVPPVIPVTVEVDTTIKFGLQAKVHLQAGDIDVTLPLDVSVRTLYNKTTDVLQILPADVKIASGASFQTTGPEGSFSLDAIAKFSFRGSISSDLDFTGLTDLDLTLPSFDESENLFTFDSASVGPYEFPQPPFAGISIIIDWPHISTSSGTPSGNALSSENASNNFLTLNLDVDQLAAYVFPLFAPIEAVIDPDPVSNDNFELLDVDLTGGLNFIQAFQLLAAGLLGTLKLENGSEQTFNFAEGRSFLNASSLDVDGDQLMEFAFGLTPDVKLTNTTKLGFNVGAHLALLKEIPIIDDSLVDRTFTLPLADLDLFQSQFAVQGFNSQEYLFAA